MSKDASTNIKFQVFVINFGVHYNHALWLYCVQVYNLFKGTAQFFRFLSKHENLYPREISWKPIAGFFNLAIVFFLELLIVRN